LSSLSKHPRNDLQFRLAAILSLQIICIGGVKGDLSREQLRCIVYTSMNTNSCCGTWSKKPWGVLILGMMGALFIYVAIYHWHYVAAYWPFLFFLACPLSHLFMKHGQAGGGGCCGGHGDGKHEPSSEPAPKP
jgi:hypothetical protein